MIARWRNSRLSVLKACPRCGEDFHVHGQFVEARPASRFLWWRTPAREAYWLAGCGSCNHWYRVPVTYVGNSP